MKPEEIKGMAKNILSDGKIKAAKEETGDTEIDGMGKPESTHIDWASGGGGMATTHFAAQPYQEGNTEDLPAPPQHHKRAFNSHDELAEHIRTVGRMGSANTVANG